METTTGQCARIVLRILSGYELAVVLLLDALSRSRPWADRAFAGLVLPIAYVVSLGNVCRWLAGQAEELGAKPSSVEAVLGAPCDVLAPCALGGVLTDETIPALALVLALERIDQRVDPRPRPVHHHIAEQRPQGRRVGRPGHHR